VPARQHPLPPAREAPCRIERLTGRLGLARAVQSREGVTTLLTENVPRALRISLGVFALLALSTLLLAGWLRFFVPSRQPERVRDVGWLRQIH
jgi:hypothetical protein